MATESAYSNTDNMLPHLNKKLVVVMGTNSLIFTVLVGQYEQAKLASSKLVVCVLSQPMVAAVCFPNSCTFHNPYSLYSV